MGKYFKKVSLKLIALLIFSIISLIGCSKLEWPPETGYTSGARNCPLVPYNVKWTEVTADIEVDENGTVGFSVPPGQMVTLTSGPYGFETAIIFPGATLRYMSKSPSTVKIKDYNGDVCIIPSGMIVKINGYGQFVPKKYRK